MLFRTMTHAAGKACLISDGSGQAARVERREQHHAAQRGPPLGRPRQPRRVRHVLGRRQRRCRRLRHNTQNILGAFNVAMSLFQDVGNIYNFLSGRVLSPKLKVATRTSPSGSDTSSGGSSRAAGACGMTCGSCVMEAWNDRKGEC